ncbi:MAG: hypothetical protein ACXABY_13015 [Candidatus Thorarchaeota archaeon]|jgi:hypothetical protein
MAIIGGFDPRLGQPPSEAETTLQAQQAAAGAQNLAAFDEGRFFQHLDSISELNPKGAVEWARKHPLAKQLGLEDLQYVPGNEEFDFVTGKTGLFRVNKVSGEWEQIEEMPERLGDGDISDTQLFAMKRRGTPQEQQFAEDMLAFRRAQAGEVSETTFAKKVAETEAGIKKDAPKVRNQMNSLNRQWDNVERELELAIEAVSPFTAGVGAWTAVVPATPARNLQARLETIRANIGFDKLQDMRANSPTGGALGQVSEMENILLQATQGSTDTGQSPAQLRETLQVILDNLKGIRQERNKAFEIDYGRFLLEQNKSQGKKETTNKGMTAEDYLKSIGR